MNCHPPPPPPDVSIILGKYFPPITGLSAYAAWSSLSGPWHHGDHHLSLASPIDQGLQGHSFTFRGDNPSFTNVEVAEDEPLLSVEPVKANASPARLCIALSRSNRTCAGAEGSFELWMRPRKMEMLETEDGFLYLD